MNNNFKIIKKSVHNRYKIQLVVSRYNENLDWLLVIKDIDILIYNKGEDDIDYIKTCLNTNCDIIKLENIGREGHTYINHIVKNYNNLYDYTIFVQGFPFDHSPNIYLKINSYKMNVNNIKFEYISNKILECDFLGRATKICEIETLNYLPIIDIYNHLFEIKINVETKINNPFELKKSTKGPIFEFSPGAQFIVSKKTIINRPVSFYKVILNIFNNPLKIYDMIKYTKINPIEGFVIERLWKYIMTPDNKHNIAMKSMINQKFKYCKKIEYWR